LKVAAGVALFCGMVLGTTAYADFNCGGTLGGVLLYSDGSVMIQGSWRSDWTMICNTQNGWGGIDGSTCLAWYGAAVSAAKSHTSVGTSYSGNTYTCANLPTYSNTPAPVYFMTLAN